MKTVIFEPDSASSATAKTALNIKALISRFINPSAAGCALGSTLGEFGSALNGRGLEARWIGVRALVDS